MFLAAAVLLTGGARAQGAATTSTGSNCCPAGQTYADRALEIGRSRAFLEFWARGLWSFVKRGRWTLWRSTHRPTFGATIYLGVALHRRIPGG